MVNYCFEKLMDTQIDILILFADQIEVPSSIFTSILFTKTESFDCHFGHLDWLGRRRQIGKKTENEISQQAEYECDLCSYLPPFPPLTIHGRRGEGRCHSAASIFMRTALFQKCWVSKCFHFKYVRILVFVRTRTALRTRGPVTYLWILPSVWVCFFSHSFLLSQEYFWC